MMSFTPGLDPTHENHRAADGDRATSLRRWRGLSWPISEAVFRSLVSGGKSDRDIAQICSVEPNAVSRLRTRYRLQNATSKMYARGNTSFASWEAGHCLRHDCESGR
jgi:hypothetical protein